MKETFFCEERMFLDSKEKFQSLTGNSESFKSNFRSFTAKFARSCKWLWMLVVRNLWSAVGVLGVKRIEVVAFMILPQRYRNVTARIKSGG